MSTTTINAQGSVNFAEPKMSAKKEYASDAQFCVQCGRLVGANPFMVEVTNGGYIRPQDGTEADTEDAHRTAYAVRGRA